MLIDTGAAIGIAIALFSATFTIAYSLVKIYHLEQEVRRLRIQLREERKKIK
jgi:hypothetical protein